MRGLWLSVVKGPEPDGAAGVFLGGWPAACWRSWRVVGQGAVNESTADDPGMCGIVPRVRAG
jgi:hypothetical protein